MVRAAVVVTAAAFVLTNTAPAVLAAAPAATGQREHAFSAAAAEFGVPADILKAISYNQSRWENHDGKPSASGGYGLMHLTTAVQPWDGRGDDKRPMQPRSTTPQTYTLDQAAQALGVSPETLKTDDIQNIRGAASLLARYAKESNNGTLPADLSDWYAAVARLQNPTDNEAAKELADTVYETIQNGASRTTLDGQAVSIAPKKVVPKQDTLSTLQLPKRPGQVQSEAECPRSLDCKWVPARFAQNVPDNPRNYGNYDTANRERDFDIKYIVIHDTEGSYQSAIDWYQDPRSYVSAQYTIRSSDGEVTQSVKNDDIAWQAGNWYVNTHSIGIEHEGFAAEGAAWYTEAMYRSSAELVRYLAKKYDIPLDREHIIAHGEIPGINPVKAPAMHWDPGPYWDWDHYMNLVRGEAPSATKSRHSNAVTIAPKFSSNKPPVTEECDTDICAPLPIQSANFVYLHTEPDQNAPFLTDAALRPDGTPGTTRIHDWSAKATHGRSYAVADKQSDWTAIWFNGQKGWFYNPSNAPTAMPAKAKRLIQAKAGKTSIPVYGRPLPEPEQYPAGAPVEAITPLQYTIPAGQSYIAYDKKAVNDYFLIWTFDRSAPGDGAIVYGNEKYIPITYNHRHAYVKASDVDIQRAR